MTTRSLRVSRQSSSLTQVSYYLLLVKTILLLINLWSSQFHHSIHFVLTLKSLLVLLFTSTVIRLLRASHPPSDRAKSNNNNIIIRLLNNGSNADKPAAVQCSMNLAQTDLDNHSHYSSVILITFFFCVASLKIDKIHKMITNYFFPIFFLVIRIMHHLIYL